MPLVTRPKNNKQNVLPLDYVYDCAGITSALKNNSILAHME